LWSVHAVSIRIANAAGFWGDDVDAPRRLVTRAQVDYLTLEYLAELTMSILAHLKGKDPRAGFATDVLSAVRDMHPFLQGPSPLRVITNAGGINPAACAQALSAELVQAGLGAVSVGVVEGDDLLPHLTELQDQGCDFAHLETGQPLRECAAPIACANAYLGAVPIVDALAQGAEIIVTGRVADASLTVAPAVHEYGWSWDDWDRLAGATVAGHLIECGAQVTGGYSNRWRDIDLVDIGYPIAELAEDGASVITKPEGSGGIVDRRSVVEQLVYEIGDPAKYYTPDVVADFTTVEVAQAGSNRVHVRGATGKPASDSYKVSLAHHAGYMAAAQLLVWGIDARERAAKVGELIVDRLARAGLTLDQVNVEQLGAGDGVPVDWQGLRGPAPPWSATPSELVVRITVRDRRRAAVERFTREMAPLITNGPSGLAGYAAGRPAVRPVLAYWPTLVPKSLVQPRVRVRSADRWGAEAPSP
jgi:hypothetical protein